MSGTPDRESPGATPDPQPDEDLLDPGIIDDDLPEAEDEPEPEEEVEEDLAPEAEPPPRQERRRGSETIQNLRSRAQQAEVERDFYRRQAEQTTQRPVQTVDPRVQQQRQAEEYERISLLPPNEQVQSIHQMIQRETAIARLEAFDLADRQNYNRLTENHPAAKRLQGRVEEVLQQQRAQGIYAFSREQVFDYLYGNEMRTKAAQRTGRERAQGAERVRRQTVRPGGGARGDVASSGRRGRTQEDQDRALLNTPIRDTM